MLGRRIRFSLACGALLAHSTNFSLAGQPIEFSPDELRQIARKEPRISQSFQADYSLGYRDTEEFSLYSKDGRQIVMEGLNRKSNKKEILWINAYSGKIENKLDVSSLDREFDSPHSGIQETYFTHDSSKVVFSTENRFLIWDDEAKKPVKLDTTVDMNDSSGFMHKVLLSPDSSKILLYDSVEYRDGKKALNRLQLFDVKTGKLLSSNDLNAKNVVDPLSWNMSWSPDGRKIFFHTSTGKVFCMDDFKTLALKPLPNITRYKIQFSSDSQKIFSYEPVFGKANGLTYMIKSWDLEGNSLPAIALPQTLKPADQIYGYNDERLFILRGDDTLELVDVKSKRSKKLFNGGGFAPHDIAVSPDQDSAVSFPSSGGMIFYPLGSPAGMAASARDQVASLIAKKALSSEEKKLIGDLLPYFFESNSAYSGLKSPADPRLREVYEQLALSQSDPKHLNPEVFKSEYLTAVSVRSLAKGAQGQIDLKAEQAKNALKILGQDEWLKPSDLESLNWLSKESGLSAPDVFQFFKNAPYEARMEAQKRLGLSPSAVAKPRRVSVLKDLPSTPQEALERIKSQGASRVFTCRSDTKSFLSNNGKFIACIAPQSDAFLVHDAQAGMTQTFKVDGIDNARFPLSFSEDSSRLYFTLPGSGQAGWVDLKTGIVHHMPSESATDVFPSRDGKKALFGGIPISIYDAETGQKVIISEISGNSYSQGEYKVAFSDDDKKAVLWSVHDELLIVDTETGKVVKKFKAQMKDDIRMKVSADGQKLYVISRNDYAVIDLPSGKDILRQAHDFDWNHSIGFGNGVFYDYNLDSGEISAFDLETGKMIERQKTSSLSGGVVDVSFSPLRILRKINESAVVEDLFPDPPEVEKLARIALKEFWDKSHLDPQERRLLFKFMAQEPGLPADATLKNWLENLRAAKRSPQNLTAAALDVSEDAPVDYFRKILEAARTPAALQARQVDASGKESSVPKFNPTPAQAALVLRKVLEDPLADTKDQEAMAWLLVRSGANMDESTLGLFKFPPEELRRDVDAMLIASPWKYKGFSSLAAIKLAKVVMDFKDEDFACDGLDADGVGGMSKGNNISSILSWFGTFGNSPDADRLLFAKLARLILLKKKLCPRDRNLLIRAMNDWKAGNAPVQHEVACVVGEQLTKTPFKDRSFEESVLIAQTVGLRSQLSWGSWVEQMRALGQMRAQHPGAMQEDEKEIYAGLVRFVVGNPEGKMQVGDTVLKVPSSPENPKSIIRLCRNLSQKMQLMNAGKEKMTTEDLDFIQGASLFLQKARSDLNEQRQWPEGFQSSAPKSSLRQEFEQKNLQEDLKALESNCTELPRQDDSSKKPLSTYQEEEHYEVFSRAGQKEKPLEKSKPPIKHSRRGKPGDFNPEGR